MLNSNLQKNEKTFILMVALGMGAALLLMHNWIENLSDALSHFQVIWPLYTFIITFALTLMMLASQPRQLLIKLALGFSVVAVGCAAYMAHVSYAVGLPDHDAFGSAALLGLCLSVAWFVSIAFFEHYGQFKQWASVKSSRYEALYQFSWRNAVKLLTAGVFVGLFWGALALLAGLFSVLHIGFFADLIRSRTFIYPATSVAFGLGLALYAAKEDALAEFKRATLHVLGWLLPLVSFILLAFLVTLPFKGLSLLWGTGFATGLMLGLMALVIFLLNTAFQDGEKIQYPAWVLKLTSAALLTLPIYVLLCVYALYLRVHQYGWTADRVWAACTVFLMAIYGMGYGFAAFKSLKTAPWMQLIKPVNVLAALCLVGMLALIHSPVLDPMRIGVQSQVAMLKSGNIKATKFDYEYLRFNGGKYGDDALHALVADVSLPEAATIKPLAQAALKAEYRSYNAVDNNETALAAYAETAASLQTKIAVYPKGAVIDPEFYQALSLEYKANGNYMYCLRMYDDITAAAAAAASATADAAKTAKDPADTAALDAAKAVKDETSAGPGCKLLLVDLNKDSKPEIVLFDGYQPNVYEKNAAVWKNVAELASGVASENFADIDTTALDAGNFKVANPQWQSLQIGKKTFLLRNKAD